MFTYITTTTVPSFPDLQEQFAISYSQVNWTVAIPALGLGLGPLFWSSVADIYGRRTIFIIGTVIALASTIGAAQARDYSGYMAARFLQGFGVSPAATVGLAVVKDLFFEHERGQKIGLWVLALDSGLFVGPIVGGFVNLLGSAWIQWFTAILFGFVLVLEVALMTETLYPRTYMLSLMPITTEVTSTAEIDQLGNTKREATEVDLKRTAKLPIINIQPIPAIRHPRPWTSMLRFVLMFKFPLIVIANGIYCFAWYWWILSIVSMIPVAYVQYSPQIQGLLFLGLLLGTLFSEAFCSGTLSDYIMVKLAKNNNGIRVPEMRLWLAYPAVLLTASKT
jgi:MFS family permease